MSAFISIVRSAHILRTLMLCVLTAGILPGVTNSLTITEKAGVQTANYPVQVGRPFVQGEITGFPRAVIDGTPVATQADVKSRWKDGSVKHAILSFLIPTLKAGQTVTVTFVNQTSGNNTGALDKAGMLASGFNFDAQIGIGTQTASARTMLNADAFTYWMQGSVATSVILADHSLARAFDIGLDNNRSVRPIFHATFWPGINKVRVRFIGEIANTEALQDQNYDLTLRTGYNAPVTAYTQKGLRHGAATRWTKEFWIGGAPPKVAINHNMAYLTSTKAVWNYDPSIRLDSTAFNSYYNEWQNSPHDLYGTGNWSKAMGGGGAHPWVSPVADWWVFWLYANGDPRADEMAFGNTDLAGAWPIHFREGKTGRRINSGDAAGSGVGKILSIKDRPSLSLVVGQGPARVLADERVLSTDRILAVGPVFADAFDYGKWNVDTMHHPETWSIPYLVTGDFWYLEELWFSVSWVATTECGSCVNEPWGRGPTGAEGGIGEQIRAGAWAIRNRATAAFLTPDGLPEKKYFEALLTEWIAIEEGARNITGSPFSGTANWNWGRTVRALETGGRGYPPLNQWKVGNPAFAQADYGICSANPAEYACNPPTTESAISLFEQDYMMMVLGRAKELGYPADRLVSWLAVNYIGQLTDPAYNPYLANNGRIPTVRLSDKKFFDSWANLKTGYKPEYAKATSFNKSNIDGYDGYLVAVGAMIADEPGGSAAWNFLKTNMLDGNTNFGRNPKWAIIPRSVSPTVPLASPCDVTGDGRVDATDVQASINQALGTSACNKDLDGNGKCDVVDVQRVINTVIDGSCRVGQ